MREGSPFSGRWLPASNVIAKAKKAETSPQSLGQGRYSASFARGVSVWIGALECSARKKQSTVPNAATNCCKLSDRRTAVNDYHKLSLLRACFVYVGHLPSVNPRIERVHIALFEVLAKANPFVLSVVSDLKGDSFRRRILIELEDKSGAWFGNLFFTIIRELPCFQCFEHTINIR